MMKLIGREHVTLDKMFDLLSTPPVLASDTIYTTLMRHDTNEYVTLHSYGSKCLLPDRARVMPHPNTHIHTHPICCYFCCWFSYLFFILYLTL